MKAVIELPERTINLRVPDRLFHCFLFRFIIARSIRRLSGGTVRIKARKLKKGMKSIVKDIKRADIPLVDIDRNGVKEFSLYLR